MVSTFLTEDAVNDIKSLCASRPFANANNCSLGTASLHRDSA